MKDNSFKEKWKDKKYQAKIKLSLYAIFILFVFVIVLFGGNKTEYKANNFIGEEEKVQEETVSFNLTNNYIVELISNDEKIIYNININDNDKLITKQIDKEELKYKESDNNYYKLEDDKYILTTKKDVYNNDYDYINIDNINNYLSKSTRIDNKYILNVKDIILGSSSEEYISINIESNSIYIDYTNLLKEFNNNCNKFTVKIIVL